MMHRCFDTSTLSEPSGARVAVFAFGEKRYSVASRCLTAPSALQRYTPPAAQLR